MICLSSIIICLFSGPTVFTPILNPHATRVEVAFPFFNVRVNIPTVFTPNRSAHAFLLSFTLPHSLHMEGSNGMGMIPPIAAAVTD